MKPEKARLLLETLGSHPEPYSSGEWVRSDCPLAPFTHKTGKDSHPSFAINVTSPRPYYHCFSCQSGDLAELIGALEMHVGKNPHWAHRYNFKGARDVLDNLELDLFLPGYDDEPVTGHKEFEEWPKFFLDSFLPALFNKEATDYLLSRGVTHAQISSHQIKYDVNRRMVCFPYWNVFGQFAGMRGRAIDANAKLKHFDYTWNKINNAALVWYNEETLQADEPVVMVEGQFDALIVEQAYPHVIANLTAKPSQYKRKRLLNCPGVILMLDNDTTGHAARDKWLEYFDEHKVKAAVVPLPEDKKDPAECGVEWAKEVLKDLVHI